jgi:hypothetical protein
MAVVVRFDWFLELIDKGVSGQALWDYFFEDALPHSEREARARVRAALLLSEESADFEEGEVRDEEGDIEYKSMDGAPDRYSFIPPPSNQPPQPSISRNSHAHRLRTAAGGRRGGI